MSTTPDPSAAPTPPEKAKRRRRGFGSRLEEGRQTFQPALWSRLIIGGVVVVYVVLFIVLNTHHVRIRFVLATARVSVIWVILLSLAIGVVLGVLASQIHRHRTRHPRS